jgi:hypothetical protein
MAEPELLAEIEYRAKSAEGKVRHPFFKGPAGGPVRSMSALSPALPPRTDIASQTGHVGKVPIGDLGHVRHKRVPEMFSP